MKTYQDFLKKSGSEQEKQEFILEAINDHKQSGMYNLAADAEEYAHQRNSTIMNYQKLLYTVSGKAVPDNYSANYKLCSNFFDRFVTQENQYLLGNGITLEKDENKKKLGKKFDQQLQKAGRDALVEGVSFGFWNYDHLESYKLTEFVPLYDEETGALMGGIRFWQLEYNKPLRATLFELDGYTDYIKKKNEQIKVLNEKRKKKCIRPFFGVKKTRENQPILKITLENGKVVRCTPDHRILTDNGWIEAKYLTQSSKIIDINAVHLVGVAKIEIEPNEDVYNMEVMGTHNFAVNGGVIVHNCMDAIRYFVNTMGIWRQKSDYTPLWN